MSDGANAHEYISIGWTVITGVASSIVTGLGVAWHLGARVESMATKEDLNNYVTKETYNEFKTDIKRDIHDLRQDITNAKDAILRAVHDGGMK